MSLPTRTRTDDYASPDDVRRSRYMTVNRPAGWTVDAFLERIVAVDPARADVVEARRSQIIDVFERVAEREPTGSYLLRQPDRVDVLIRVY